MGVAGNSICDPTTLFPNENGIDGTYFTEYDWSEINSRPLQNGDILYWPGTHAAYVTSVPMSGGQVDVNNIGVSHMSAFQWSGVISETLAAAKSRVGVGNPSKFCRKKQVSITVSNSFSAGDVKVAGSSYSSGSSVPVNWWASVSLEALNQDYQNVWRQWNNWQKAGEGSPTTQNPRTIYAAAGDGYTSNFTHWSDISFSNSLPGASGESMSVWDTTRNAPGLVRMQKDQQFNIAATTSYQINRIQYTFSQWSGASISANASLSQTATEHKEYTANYNAKPLWPENVSAGGAVDDPVEITWTEHPHESVTQYQIWRIIKPLGQGQGQPEHIETVNRGTTSSIDYGCIMTESYTHDLVSYDVRAFFSVNSSYSDPNYVAVFANSTPPGRVEDQEMTKTALPMEFSISNYPNPFNPSTTIIYQLVEEANVILHIFDVMGREVASLVNDRKNAGYHSIPWHGKDSRGITVASGTYFYRFTASPLSGKEPYAASGKLLLTK